MAAARLALRLRSTACRTTRSPAAPLRPRLGAPVAAYPPASVGAPPGGVLRNRGAAKPRVVVASATHAASVAPDEKEPPSSRSLSISVFSTASYVRDFLGAPLAAAFPGATVRWFESRLHDLETAQLAAGADVVCLFVNDKVTAEVAALLHRLGVRLIVMRCAGFDRVDVAAARALGIPVVRVPAYSPSAIAEHAVALLMCLNRNLHKAYARVREGDFTLNGLVGFNVAGKTVGVVGTGRIGLLFARIMAAGFGAKLLGVDLYPVPEFRNLGGEYVSMEELVHRSDIISLHCPLSPSSTHLIGAAEIRQMKKGVVLINTSRGGLVDTRAAIDGILDGTIGALGMDVYEHEGPLFFRNFTGLSMSQRIQRFDEKMGLLTSLPNVLISPHSAFLTQEALDSIAQVWAGSIYTTPTLNPPPQTTIDNIRAWDAGEPLVNAVKP